LNERMNMARQATAKKAERRFVVGRGSKNNRGVVGNCPGIVWAMTEENAESLQKFYKKNKLGPCPIYELTPVKPGAGKKGGRK